MLGLDTEFQYEISSAANLTDGLKTVESNRPDVVILDLFVGRRRSPPSQEKGMTFIETVKANPSLKDIPIIVFSNLDDPELNEPLI